MLSRASLAKLDPESGYRMERLVSSSLPDQGMEWGRPFCYRLCVCVCGPSILPGGRERGLMGRAIGSAAQPGNRIDTTTVIAGFCSGPLVEQVAVLEKENPLSSLAIDSESEQLGQFPMITKRTKRIGGLHHWAWTCRGAAVPFPHFLRRMG